MDKDYYQKITFDEACNLLTNKGGPITIYAYIAFRKPPSVSEVDITGCSDDKIIMGSSEITRFGWNNSLANQDKIAKTRGSGYYIKKSKIQQRAINVAANDPNSRLSKMPSEMINKISEYVNIDHVPFKTNNELRGDEAYNKGNIPFYPSKDDGNTSYNLMRPNTLPFGGKVRTRKNRKSRKNKYKKNKSRRKYNKKRHHTPSIV